MKKIFTFFPILFLLLAATQMQAQVISNKLPLQKKALQTVSALKTQNPHFEKCGFQYSMEQANAKGFNDALYEQVMQQLIDIRRQQNSFGPPATIYTLPVIFHVLYAGSIEPTPGIGANIANINIQAQVDQLNKDFANMSGSTYGVAEDMGLRFTLAKVDPLGNFLCEAGVDRINWESKGWTDPSTLSSTSAVQTLFDNTIKPQSIWDPNRYVNIWLADLSASGLLGYASFPALSGLSGLNNSETDQTAGVVIEVGSVGSTTVPGSAAPYDLGRTITHELGHFFGLRHINGDGNCLTDYCADTPPQSALTSGCPSPGTLNGCTPSVAKMFENYMDYSNDLCLNTFTLNQSERCQVVMANSPRRLQLISSNTGVSPMPNRIFFKSAPSVITETATGLCPRYKDYVVSLGIDQAATGNATVSLSKSGTATDGADYTIINPTVNYTNGDGASKNFTLRVYDDAVVEGSETIILGISISGTGVQTAPACASSNQVTITLADDDYNFNIDNLNPTITLLNENFGTTTGTNAIPTGWTVSNSGTATNKWVCNNANAATYGFTGNSLHISNGNTTAVNNGTAAINYSTTVTTDARVTTPLFNITGLKDLNLSFNYVCNGEVIGTDIYDLGVLYYALNGSTSYSVLTDGLGNPAYFYQKNTLTNFNLQLPSFIQGNSSIRFLFRWISDNTGGSQPPFSIDDFLFTAKSVTVQTAANASATENVFAGSTENIFYSADGKILAKLTNPSVSLGCVTANISNTFSGLAPLNTNAGSYQRSTKVFTITPAVANSTASYQATFYFTTAEMAPWGTDVPNLKLMKVKDGVSLSSTLNPSNSIVVTPTVDDQRATKGYVSYTANFTGGFSQFVLVSPNTVIPVSLLEFEAFASGKKIILRWATAVEINNRGFYIDRSTDGIQFEKIGWVDGQANSSSRNNYIFDDNFAQPGVQYYYRLRQADFSGTEKQSDIRQAKIKGDGIITITVSPNPARDKIRVFAGGSLQPANITLLNVDGKKVRDWMGINISSNNTHSLDVSGLAKGVYLLTIKIENEKKVQKLIIQ